MGGRSSSGQAAQALNTLQMQSSAYGIPIPIVGGVARLAGNLIYYNDFKSTPHSSSGGGKGGGGGGNAQPTSYTYRANVLMALCHGQIHSIPRVWKGQQTYSDTTGTVTQGNAAQIATANEYHSVPAGGATYTVAHAATFGSLTSITAFISTRNGNYQITAALDVDFYQNNGVFTIPVGSPLCGQGITITYQYTTTYATNPALAQLGLSMLTGTIGQAPPSWVASLHPANSLGYSNIACVSGVNYQLNNNAQVDNHNFEVVAQGAYSLGPNIPDIDLATFSIRVLEDLRYGAMIPSKFINSTAQWTASNLANNLLFSPVLDTQMKAADFISQAAMLSNIGLVWSAGTLKFIPYCDVTVSGNGTTFTPNTTPVYSLTDSVFITNAGDPPVQITRIPAKKCFNHFRVNYKNRGNSYAPEIAEAKDSSDILVSGLRTAPIVDASWCCDANIARNIAQFLLQRSLYQRGTYEFTLPWNFIFLEPMDIVTITDTAQGLTNYAVRITRIEEDSGDLKFTAEEFNQGVASTASYSTQIGAGFGHNYNVAPGNANDPVIFEAPVTFTSNGLEVSIAASSYGTYWGGCNVWISLDGTNYKQAGQITGNSRYGNVVADSGSSMTINNMSGSLLSGSAADSAAYTTLCYVSGPNPEYLAFQGASLTGAGAYTLSGLTRGGYNTTQATQAAGRPFVRVDANVVQSGPIDLNMIGKTIYVKLCGYNVYGGAVQSLADVTAYSYTIQGTMLKLPPAPPTNLQASFQSFGIFLQCGKSSNPDIVRYEYRSGATWASANLITHDGSTSCSYGLQPAGSYTVWVAAVDIFGNYSAPISTTFTLAPPTMATLTNTINGRNLQLNFTANQGSLAIFEYEVRSGPSGCTFATAVSMGFYNTNTYQEVVNRNGNYSYFVAALDIAGNYSTPLQLLITTIGPSAPTNAYANVIDNDVLQYWTAPAVALNQLPIASYKVYKGATFGTATLIGSNGNSTFSFVFESLAGNYTYWITAIDTAGTEGPPVSFTATVNQPPDFIFQGNYQSSLNGTLVNAVVEQGVIKLPVNTSETFAQHFANHSWNTPVDQIAAGFPIYADPSTTTASYTEIINYGVVIPTTLATTTLGTTLISGNVGVTCQISWKLNSGDAWTALAPGPAALIPNSFQYLRIVYSFTATAGANLLQINNLSVLLATKQRNDSGNVAAITSGTTAVTFNYPFLQANTPFVVATGLDAFSKPYNCAVIFTGGPNPTGFSVQIFNSAGTLMTSGVGFSWTARGY